MADMNLNRMEVIVVSGFLGAGKTTLIQAMIKHSLYSDNRLVVLENEFGKVNIDGKLLERLDIKLENIVSSCICCSGALVLQDKLMDIAAHIAPSRLLIEPAGVARLSDVKRIFHFGKVREVCLLNKIITVIDAVNYNNWLKVSKDLFEDQIRFSNILYISKSNRRNQEELIILYDLLEKINPNCPIFIDENALFAFLKKDEVRAVTNTFPSFSSFVQIRNDFDVFSFEREAMLNLKQFEQLLDKVKLGIYGKVYRLKGVFSAERQTRYSIDFVFHEYRIVDLKPNKKIIIELSFIGKGIDAEALESALQCCLA